MKNQQNGSTSFKDAYNKAKGAAPVAQSQKKVINVIDIESLSPSIPRKIRTTISDTPCG